MKTIELFETNSDILIIACNSRAMAVSGAPNGTFCEAAEALAFDELDGSAYTPFDAAELERIRAAAGAPNEPRIVASLDLKTHQIALSAAENLGFAARDYLGRK